MWTAVAWYLPLDFGRFIDPIVCRISDVKTCNALMETIVLDFPNISSLIIVDGSANPSQPGPLLVNAYTACASNLRTLNLIATSANFTALFPSNASALTSLEEVNLSFSPRDDGNADAEAVSTFFQAIASTLTTLNISFYGTSDEPSRLLQSFLRQGGKTAFPKLASFSLFHLEPSSSPGSNLVQFLNQHADTLKHLRMQHIKPSPPFVSQSLDGLDPLLLPVLPHLESLHVLNGSSSRGEQELASSEGLDAARAYVQHSGRSLIHLGLTHCSFTLHDLGMLLDLLKRGSSEGGELLKSLTVTVQALSPELLDMLAEKLPQLERLKFDFADLRRNNGVDVPTWTGGPALSDLKCDVTNSPVFCGSFFPL